MIGCELFNCSHFINGVCHYDSDVCKFNEAEDERDCKPTKTIEMTENELKKKLRAGKPLTDKEVDELRKRAKAFRDKGGDYLTPMETN